MPRLVALLLSGLVLTACSPGGERQRLVLGSTHTLDDSGLLDVLETQFTEAHPEIALAVVVAGSGEILTMARNGDLDVLLTHSPEDETAFMAGGHGEARHPVMHNEFVLVGPADDPAQAASARGPADALRRIEEAGAPFISRGDDSGTHRRERALWADAQTVPDWSGYTEAGSGMADALRLAGQRRAYVLSDRATFEKLRDELAGLRIVSEGDRRLHNQYSVIIVSGAARLDAARAFADWLRSDQAQQLIRGFGSDRSGRPLFDTRAQ